MNHAEMKDRVFRVMAGWLHTLTESKKDGVEVLWSLVRWTKSPGHDRYLAQVGGGTLRVSHDLDVGVFAASVAHVTQEDSEGMRFETNYVFTTELGPVDNSFLFRRPNVWSTTLLAFPGHVVRLVDVKPSPSPAPSTPKPVPKPDGKSKSK